MSNGHENNAQYLLREFQSFAWSRLDETLDGISSRLAQDVWHNVFVDESEKYGTIFIEHLIERWPTLVRKHNGMVEPILDEFKRRILDGGEFLKGYFGGIAGECLQPVGEIILLNLSAWGSRALTDMIAVVEQCSHELSNEWHTKYENQSALLKQCQWKSPQWTDVIVSSMTSDYGFRSRIEVEVIQKAFEQFMQKVVMDVTAPVNSGFTTVLRIVGAIVGIRSVRILERCVTRLQAHKRQYALYLRDAFLERSNVGTQSFKDFLADRWRTSIREELTKSFEQQKKALDAN